MMHIPLTLIISLYNFILVHDLESRMPRAITTVHNIYFYCFLVILFSFNTFMFFFEQFGVDKSEIVEWLTMPAWGSVCFVLTRAIMMHLVFKKSCFVFHINYSCIVYGLVLFFVDLTFFILVCCL